jgi:flagellar basal-body rod modification protein FlgD
MDITSITSATGLNFLDPAVANRATGKQTLDANDFLRLLTVQLQSQDPMKPMEDMQFISQMASFTSLEQMRALSADFQDFTSGQRLVAAQNYLGRVVTVETDEGTINGEVIGVTVEKGTPMLTIGSQSYDLADVTSVKPKATEAAPATSTNTPTVGAGPEAATTPNQ